MSAKTEITELQQRKLDKRFALLDMDGNGYVSKDDYDLLVTRLLTAYGKDRSSTVGADVAACYDRLWQGLARAGDSDGDGRVSRQEFCHAVFNGVLRGEDGLDAVVESTQKAILRLADSDANGTLSLDEFTKLIGVYGVSAQDAATFFEAADTDGDRALTAAEILAADRDFYHSADPVQQEICCSARSDPEI